MQVVCKYNRMLHALTRRYQLKFLNYRPSKLKFSLKIVINKGTYLYIIYNLVIIILNPTRLILCLKSKL